MNKPRDDRQKDLLRPALNEIIDLGHPLPENRLKLIPLGFFTDD